MIAPFYHPFSKELDRIYAFASVTELERIADGMLEEVERRKARDRHPAGTYIAETDGKDLRLVREDV